MMDAEERSLCSPGEHDHSGTMGSARIIQHDSHIKCTCPPGTKRNAEDIVMLRTDNTLIWYHAPCKPFLSTEFEAAGTTAAALLRNRTSTTQGDARALTEKMLTASLGPDASERQLQKVRTITSTFRCDGPCRGSIDHKDYFWCYRCFAWQHKPCVLFGEDDRGRPVCNVCYVHAMMHEDDRNLWQSKRLAQAATEALHFIRDPRNEKEHVGLAFATKFLANFLSNNRKKLLEFVINRRRVARWIKARRGLPQPVYGAAQPVAVVTATATPSAVPAANGRSARKKRKVTRSEATTSAATGDSLDDGDLGIEGDDQVEQLRKTDLRRSKRNSITLEPLVVEQSAEDDARNERMRKAAALKARKKAASTSMLGTQNGTDPAQATPEKLKRRASRVYQENDDDNFEDIGIFSRRHERNLAQASTQKSRPARKSAPSAGQLAEQVDISDASEDEAADVESVPRPRNKGKQRQIIHKEHEDDSSRRPLEAVTAAPGHPVGPDQEAIPPASPAPPYAPARVLPSSSIAVAKTTAAELEPAAAHPQREPLSDAMQQEVRTLCRTILWDAYCDLPDPNEADGPISSDRTKIPPPSDWLAEAEKRVTIMFEAAGSDKIAEYLRHEFVQWPRNSLNIVKAMREFAMWMRLKGPFRRTRRELGLVAEILGFEDKGRYWRPDQKDGVKDEASG